VLLPLAVALEPSDPTAPGSAAVIIVAYEPRDSLVAREMIDGAAEAPGVTVAAAKDNTAEASAAKLGRLGIGGAPARVVFSWPMGPSGFGNFTAGKNKACRSALFVSRVALQYREPEDLCAACAAH
jgi:hypothetical protein